MVYSSWGWATSVSLISPPVVASAAATTLDLVEPPNQHNSAKEQSEDQCTAEDTVAQGLGRAAVRPVTCNFKEDFGN